jgi:hypothetical protein
VLHNKPFNGGGSTEPTTYSLTSLFLSCSGANGTGEETNSDDVVKGIFKQFTKEGQIVGPDGSTVTVKCVSPFGSQTCMKYWGGDNPLDEEKDPVCRSIEGLLKYKDANCGEWADFFNDMLRIQGIKSKVVTVIYGQKSSTGNTGLLSAKQVDALKDDTKAFFDTRASIEPLVPNIGYEGFFFVKNAVFAKGVRNFYLAREKPGEYALRPTTISILGCDDKGVMAQGNYNPRYYFQNHVIVSYKNKSGETIYYDPSYGTGPFKSQMDWEAASLDGYGGTVICTLSVNKEMYTVNYFFESEDPQKIQTTFLD